jgi:hypothetical protein
LLFKALIDRGIQGVPIVRDLLMAALLAGLTRLLETLPLFALAPIWLERVLRM